LLRNNHDALHVAQNFQHFEEYGDREPIACSIARRNAGRIRPRQLRNPNGNDILGVRSTRARRHKVSGSLVSVRTDLHPRQRHGKGRIPQGVRGTRRDICRAGHKSSGKGTARRSARQLRFPIGYGILRRCESSPFAKNYRMWSYITEELLGVMAENFPADMERQTILAHSMGGHRALTIALRNPQRYRAASAFSPIVAPSQVPWGIKALNGYLGEKRRAWREYDAVALIEDGARLPELLVDCGDADPFLAEQLRSELLKRACADASIPLNLRHQHGFDHSYHFVSTFMEEHLRWHADRLRPCDRLASNKASPSRGRNCLHAPYLQPKCAGQSLMTPKKLAGL
jgi:S-formylglutathione hydrolase